MRALTSMAILPALTTAVSAAPDCRNSEYRDAITSISSTLQRYTSCLNASDGRNDCSLEFPRLRRAQDDLETAVASYSTTCRQ